MRLSILLLVLLLLPFICFSQQTISAEQFFKSGLSNFSQIEKLARDNVKFPWINKYEFRTETRDFNFGEQEYTIRLSPSTAKIRNAQKAYYDAMRNAPDMDGQEIYCDYVLSLHLDWLALFMLNEHQRTLDELVVLLNDKQTTYERMLGTFEFDTKKLVNLQTDKSDIEIASNKLKLDRDFLLKKYNLENQEFDFSNFITVEAISEYLSNNLPTSENSAAFDLETAYKKEMLLKEIDLENSEENRIIDFVQVKYNGPHSDEIRERLSVGLGFQLSNSGNSRLKMQELQIEQEELDLQLARDTRSQQTNLEALENELQSDIQAFFYFVKIHKEERENLQQLSANISQKEGTSPLILLDIEERNLSLKLRAISKRESLFEDYLNYLQETDKMCQPTFVNFLTQ